MSSLQIFGLQTALSFAVYGLVAILDGAIRPLAVARRRCYARSTSLIVNRPRIAEVSNMGCPRTTRPRRQNS